MNKKLQKQCLCATVFASLVLLSNVFGLAGSIGNPSPAPDLNRRERVDEIFVFPDARQQGIYYYAPRRIELDRDGAGIPRIQLLDVRYLGTRKTRDSGELYRRCVLTWDVRLVGPSKRQLAEVRKYISAKHRTARLLPLPIKRIETKVIAPFRTSAPDERKLVTHRVLHRVIGEGQGVSLGESLRYTVRLTPFDLLGLKSAMQHGHTTFALAYAIYVDVQGGIDVSLTSTENGRHAPLGRQVETKERIQDGPFRNAVVRAKQDLSVARDSQEHLLLADAISLSVDPPHVPHVLKVVDLNRERLLSIYPAIDVYCFDFAARRSDQLVLKLVEIRAISPPGQFVYKRLEFSLAEPHATAKTARFEFAVSLDEPYSFRVTDVFRDGSRQSSDWSESPSWSSLLHVGQHSPGSSEAYQSERSP